MIPKFSLFAAMACLIAIAALVSISQTPIAPMATTASASNPAPDIRRIDALLQSPNLATAKATTDPIQFAWMLFMDVNWPAMPNVRGRPDPNKPFSAPGPVVWQTWKTSQNMYVPRGQRPLLWTQGPLYQPPALQSAEIDGKILTDDNGNPVMYEVRLNRDTFNQILGRGLFSQAGQLALLQGGQPVAFPLASMEVKASWRFLGTGDNPNHYLTAFVRYQGVQRLVGLNGLHITSKALPQWFWCTFEQIENAQTTPITLKLPIADAVQQSNKTMQAGLAGTKWAYYRLNGVQTEFVKNPEAASCIDNPGGTCLANSQMETYFQGSSSCITCHSRASIGPNGTRASLWNYVGGNQQGFVGTPPPMKSYVPLDFVWSMREAQ
jgi:hypothetical protein